MLVADVVKDYSLTVMLPGVIQEKELRAALSPMVARGFQDILAEGVEEREIIIDQYLDMRYQGQSFELTIPFSVDYLANFHNAHNEAYGFHDLKQPVEIVNIRVRAVGKAQQLPIKQYPISRSNPSRAKIGYRQAYYPFGSVNVPLFDAKLLLPGNRIPGPARIIRTDTTIVAGPNDIIEIDSFLNTVITLD
jgi:N-methylhydantoinase A